MGDRRTAPDQALVAHEMGLYVADAPFLVQRGGAGVKGLTGHRLVRDRL